MLYKVICFFFGHKPYYDMVSTQTSKGKNGEHFNERRTQISADHCTRCLKPNNGLSQKEIDKIVNNNATNLIKSFEDHLKGS